MWNKFVNKIVNPVSSGIEVTLEEFIALRIKVDSSTRVQSKKDRMNYFQDKNIAKIRGRGIEFDTTREYQPGDDIRQHGMACNGTQFKTTY